MMRINLLIDLSGTLHIGDTACPGAVSALHRLCSAKTTAQCSSVRLRFCSNTTKESTQDLQKRLQRAGFAASDVPTDRITTSLEACKLLCVEQQWKPLLLLTPSAQASFRESLSSSRQKAVDGRRGANTASEGQLQHAFFPAPDTPPERLSDEERAQLRACDTVVVGLAPSLFTAAWLDEAFRILTGEYEAGPKRLVATHRALYFRPTSDGPLSMGPGAYVAALEAASRRKADDTIVCGKPSKTFLETCLNSMHQEQAGSQQQQDTGEERNIIVGDDVDADLGGGAIELGLERVLVQTGKYRSGDEERSSEHPVRVFGSFADFVQQELFDSGLLEPTTSE